MVMVSNLPNLPEPIAAETDVAIVSRNNQLFKISLDDLFAAGSINVDESTVDHNLLFNYNALEHIDWTNASETLVTTGQVLASNISGINTGDQNLFSTFSVLGLTALDDIVATETADTFTFVPGPNIAITTNPTTKELFISAGGATGNLPLNIVEDSFTYPADYDGTTPTLTLSVAPPSADNVFVFFDGVYEGQAEYTILGSDIQFNANIPAYVQKVDVVILDEVDLDFERSILTAGVDYNIGDTAITLGSIPASSDNLLMFFNGAFQGSNTYTLAGSTVTFNSPIPSGTTKIEYINFVDTGSNILEISLGRQIYLDGVNFTGGLTNLLPLPNPVQSTADVLVFFDAIHVGSDKYSVNGTIVEFTAPVPTYVSKVEIITISGGEGISSLSFGRIDVPSQSSIVADTVSDTFTLIPGTNIDILTNPLTSEITINNTQTIPPAFDAIVADSGGNLNASTSSTVNILGGTEIDVTSDGVDTLTVTFTGSLGDPDQNLWETITADSGFTTADTINDNLTVAGGTLINTSITGDTLTIDFTGAVGDPDQNIFDRVQIDGVDSFLAGSTTDPINFEQGANILISNPSPNTLRFDTGGALGESNTASNSGLGESLVLPKIGVDLPFKGINTTDPNVSVTSDATDVLIGLNIPTLEGNLNHDNLAGFVADEHIDWTSATQNLSTTGTVGSSNYDATGSVAAGSVNSGTNTGDQNLWYYITTTSGPNSEPNVLQDSLNFIAGTGMQVIGDGFGSIEFRATAVGEANTADSPTLNESLILPKIGTILEFKGIAAGDTNVTISSTPFDVTVGLNIPVLETNLNHDNLTGFVANEHIDWTNATQDILTTGTITGSNLSGTNTGDQNLWATVTSDSGSTTADALTDNLFVLGGAFIDTSIVGDNLTIDFNNPNAILESYTLPNQQIQSGLGPVIVPHTLSGVPRIVHIDLICIDPGGDAGYSFGQVANPFFVQAAQNNRGVAIIETATDIIYTYGSNASVFLVIDPNSGSSAAIDNTKWEMVISVFR